MMSKQVKIRRDSVLMAAMLFNTNMLKVLREDHPKETQFVLVDQDKSKSISDSEYKEIEDQIDELLKTYKQLINLVVVSEERK
jgi:hypothetical protein